MRADLADPARRPEALHQVATYMKDYLKKLRKGGHQATSMAMLYNILMQIMLLRVADDQILPHMAEVGSVHARPSS